MSVPKVSFEEVQSCFDSRSRHVVINTMPSSLQSCLIRGTTVLDREENVMNELIKSRPDTQILIYGMNCNDDTIYAKHQQLVSLGLTCVKLYPGGMFEWLCLQEIYGKEAFPTTTEELDILKYKPTCRPSPLLIEDSRP